LVTAAPDASHRLADLSSETTKKSQGRDRGYAAIRSNPSDPFNQPNPANP
jgi:hypothetical protein